MFKGSMNLKSRASMFDGVKQYEREKGSLPTAKSNAGLACGGRSMGARAAVIAAHTDEDVKTLVLASYPLVSPSGDMRDQILLDIRPDVDVLFISGDNDSMCDLETLNVVRGKMKARTWRVVVKGADHGMNLKGGKKLKEGTELVGRECGQIAAEWLRERDQGKKEMVLSWDGEEGIVVNTGWRANEGTKKVAEESHTEERNEGDTQVEKQKKVEAEGGRGKRKKTRR